MSLLTLSTDPETLAERLAERLDRHMRAGDFFAPISVVVPNRYLGKWLRLALARRLGVVANLRFQYLEGALWDWFRALDPRPHPAPPEHLETESYQYLVLHVLLTQNDPDLELLQHYLGLEPNLSRMSCRRAWELAERLGGFIRDYEYHRQYHLIRPWLRNDLGLPTNSHLSPLERSQRAIFRHITRLPDGRRERLIQATGRLFKTLPQYGNEVMELLDHPPAPPGPIYLFGITQISAWHVEALRWLGIHYDLNFYTLSPIIGRLVGPANVQSLQSLARSYAEGGDDGQPGRELLRLWGRAGAESLGLVAEFLTAQSFRAEVLSAPKPRRSRPMSLLARLQEHLLHPQRVQPAAKTAADTSLQIVGCPGVLREVETVHNCILKNLNDHPELRLTDIVVLVTDMKTYRPYLQAVFERPPRPIAFNLIDFSAAGLSSFGQALVGMFDLALESFARSKVFDVLLNPCFLAKLGIERSRAKAWVEWAQELGIFQGWDAQEKAERGLPPSPLYAWKLGLQRLRLGRYMEITADDASGPAPCFHEVIPFADLQTDDVELLDAFVLAVESLLPTLTEFRKFQGSATAWAERIRRLVHTYLAVPEDRPEEEQVRDRLLASLEHLRLWDHLGGDRPLPLPLVREMLYTQLETMEASRGEYLTGGVTLSAFQPMRPVPFAIVYVLGLGEQDFPGNNLLGPMDLRLHDRQPGDIRPAEHQRYLFLEAILSARQKLYLFFNSWDVLKDRELLPAVPIVQMQRYVSRHFLSEPLAVIKAPLLGTDPMLLDPEQQPAGQDVLVQYRVLDRLLAVREARHQGRLALTLNDDWEWKEKMQEIAPDFTVVKAAPARRSHPPTVSAHELSEFLIDPAQAILKRHLHLEADDDLAVDENYEPVVTSERLGARLVKHVLTDIILQAAEGKLEKVLAEWPEHFDRRYDDWRLRCRVPERGFGDVDRQSLRAEVQDRLEQGLTSFLRARTSSVFCGPVLLGESWTPMQPKLKLPALALDLPRGDSPHARLVGTTRLAWTGGSKFETLVLYAGNEFEVERLSPQLLKPMLLYLMLLASEAEGLSAKTFRIHVLFKNGMRVLDIPAECIAPTEAKGYLAELTAEFLDPESCQRLPWRVLLHRDGKDLRAALESPEAPGDFAQAFREVVAENFGSRYGAYVAPMAKTLDLDVPDAAHAILRRRFGLLDRPCAQLRAANGQGADAEDAL